MLASGVQGLTVGMFVRRYHCGTGIVVRQGIAMCVCDTPRSLFLPYYYAARFL
jgi:hypothetical protein